MKSVGNGSILKGYLQGLHVRILFCCSMSSSCISKVVARGLTGQQVTGRIKGAKMIERGENYAFDTIALRKSARRYLSAVADSAVLHRAVCLPVRR